MEHKGPTRGPACALAPVLLTLSQAALGHLLTHLASSLAILI